MLAHTLAVSAFNHDSLTNFQYIEGVVGLLSDDDPVMRDPGCTAYNKNACVVNNTNTAALICEKNPDCAGFILNFLFAEPMRIREAGKSNEGIFTQNGYVKNGKRYVFNGTTIVAGAAITTTQTSAPTTSVPTPTSPSSASESKSVPLVPIIAGAGGGLLLIVAAIIGFCYFKKRRNNQSQQGSAALSSVAFSQPSMPPGKYPEPSASIPPAKFPEVYGNHGSQGQPNQDMYGQPNQNMYGQPNQNMYGAQPNQSFGNQHMHAAPLAPAPASQFGGYQPQQSYMPSVAPVPEKTQMSEKGAMANSSLFTHSMSGVPVFDWTPEIVGSWISSKGFPSYIAQTLSSNDINGTRLLLLTDAKLQSMGIVSPDVCHSIRTCIDQLREESASSSNPASGSVPPPYIPDENANRASDRKTPAFRDL
ncbi:hypothetical protein HDU67_009741 [Dinochytrium kinnereticum]|nr:hypothetical protein HDU67_009741 [Dinochytrium kinnereticum]